MSKQIISRAVATLALTLVATTAFAGESARIDNTKTVGALTLETQGLATNIGSVHRQCVSACNFDPLRRGIGVQF